MTPLEYSREKSLDYSKVTSLEVAHIDIYEDTPKLDSEYSILLKPKRLSKVRYRRYKT